MLMSIHQLTLRLTLALLALALFAIGVACDTSSDDVSETGGGAADTPGAHDTADLNDRDLSAGAVVVLPDELGEAERPVAPARIEGACPFECCRYGTWTMSDSTRVYADADSTSMVIATIGPGTTLQAVTGHVKLSRIGAAVARDSVQLFLAHDEHVMVAPGDTVLLLDHIGEGMQRMWYKGVLYHGEMPELAQAPDGGKRLETLATPVLQWWAQVTLSDGTKGWLWMDHTPPVKGADGCG